MTTRHIESFLWEAFDRVAAIPFFGDGDDGNSGHYHYHGRTDDVATVIPDGSRQLAEEEEEEEDGAGGGSSPPPPPPSGWTTPAYRTRICTPPSFS